MPLFPNSVLNVAKYSKGVRKTKRDPFTTLNPKGNRMARFGVGGEDTVVMPTRLEVRRGKGTNYDMIDTLERNEAYTKQSIDNLRSHLARKTGQAPKPTTARRTSSIYNSPGGDLNVPSYGTMGNPLSKRELLKRARARKTPRGGLSLLAEPLAYGIAGGIKTGSIGGVLKGLNAWKDMYMPSKPSGPSV